MFKKALFPLLVSVTLWSCNHGDSSPAPVKGTFKVAGIHDVIVITPSTNQITTILPITIGLEAGAPAEPVTLSVTGMPKQAAALVQQLNGTPPFATEIFFTTGVYDTLLAGTYPVKVVAKSANDTIEYPLNLISPSGWNCNENFYKPTMNIVPVSATNPASYIECISTDNGGSTLKIIFKNGMPLPTTNGVYTVVENPVANDEVGIEYSMGGNNFHSVDNITPIPQIQILLKNGKISVWCDRLSVAIPNTTAVVSMSVNLLQP